MTNPTRTPAVSVCIPTYKGAAHLRTSIESVLAQTFGDLELVIVDDNSPDDTFAIASGYQDLRVRCLRNDRNLGAEGNWNRWSKSIRVSTLPMNTKTLPAPTLRRGAISTTAKTGGPPASSGTPGPRA